MASKNSECQETPQCPNFEIAQLKFLLTLPEYHNDAARTKQLYKIIICGEMAPYYEIVCKDLNWDIKEQVLEELKAKNKKILDGIDKEIDDCKNDVGMGISSTDMKDFYLNKANYLSKIGDKENAIIALSHVYNHTAALKNKLDNVNYCIRVGLFFMDTKLIQRNIDRAESLMEQGADWQSRNCFKIYKALYFLLTRDFKSAADFLVNSVSTFICTELLSYEKFIKYTLLSAILTLSRREVKKELIDNPDMQQALHEDLILKEYLYSLYNCDYKNFFLRLADIEVYMRQDMFLNPHYKFYVREMKIKAYDQLLSTYISVNISYMSDQFGVSDDYIENELSKLIAAGRLNYKIDKISGKVVNQHRDSKMEVFKAVIKHGDLVLNRIHKLSRVINI